MGTGEAGVTMDKAHRRTISHLLDMVMQVLWAVAEVTEGSTLRTPDPHLLRNLPIRIVPCWKLRQGC